MARKPVIVDMKAANNLAHVLHRFGGRVARKATASGLTTVAKIAASRAKSTVARDMTIRNHWTLGSIESTLSP